MQEKRNISNLATYFPLFLSSQLSDIVMELSLIISVPLLTEDNFRFISQDTIEEGIYTVAQDKLKL